MQQPENCSSSDKGPGGNMFSCHSNIHPAKNMIAFSSFDKEGVKKYFPLLRNVHFFMKYTYSYSILVL